MTTPTTNPDILTRIKALYFNRDSFEKFTNPRHPEYTDYKDRTHELWHDKGWNNALDYVLHELTGKRHVNGETTEV